MTVIIDDFFIHRDKLLAELEIIPTDYWTRTGSGLYRYNLHIDMPNDFLSTYFVTLSKVIGQLQAHWVMWHKPGGPEIFQHEHNEWATAVYFPKDHETALDLDGDLVYPRSGRLALLPARTLHGVQANETEEDRYSVIALFPDPGQEGWESLDRLSARGQEES